MICINSTIHQEYQFVKLIGQGSFAKVYLVKRRNKKAVQAVKCFSKLVLFTEKLGKKSLMNEIRILRDLNHPNIIQLYQVHETANSIYLVMDLVSGGDIFSFIQEKGKGAIVVSI